VVADPDGNIIAEQLSRFSKAELGTAVVGVSYAKELAMLGLPHVANALVRADGSDESVASALERDRVWIGREARASFENAVRIERDHRWSSPLKLGEDRAAVGIRFTGSLSAEGLDELQRLKKPVAVAEAKHHESREQTWKIEGGDLAVTMRSPLGSTFGLSILEG
jgi:hypothetical protein